MTFEDQKFLSSWGAAIFILLLLVNYDYFSNFWWAGLLGFELILAGSVFCIFLRSASPTLGFYVLGGLLFASLFVAYSSFFFAIVSRMIGGMWLWLLVPLWIGATIIYIRRFLFLPDGTTQMNTSVLSISGVLGASLSGLLVVLFSRESVMLAITITLDFLISFVMASAMLVWSRHMLRFKRKLFSE